MSAEITELQDLFSNMLRTLKAAQDDADKGDIAQLWKAVREMGRDLQACVTEIDNLKERFQERNKDIKEDITELNKRLQEAVALLEKSTPAKALPSPSGSGEATQKLNGRLILAVLVSLAIVASVLGVDLKPVLGK